MDDTLHIPGHEVEGPFQFADCYLYDMRVTRESLEAPEDGPALTLEPKIRGWTLADDRLSLIVILGAVVRHQFRPEARAELEVTAAGSFICREPVDADLANQFAKTNGLVLLWPYLRSYIAMTASAMQIDLPPLPVLDVSAIVHRMVTEAGAIEPLKRSGSKKRTAAAIRRSWR